MRRSRSGNVHCCLSYCCLRGRPLRRRGALSSAPFKVPKAAAFGNRMVNFETN